jgi:hypothetical protein
MIHYELFLFHSDYSVAGVDGKTGGELSPLFENTLRAPCYDEKTFVTDVKIDINYLKYL